MNYESNPLTPWLVIGGLLGVAYFLNTKKGTDQLIGMLASAFVTGAVQAIVHSAPQRRQLW